MTQEFDPNDPAALDAALSELGREEVALDPAFRQQLLSDAAQVTALVRRPFWSRVPELLGLAGLPAAALAGAWIGLANPALVLQAAPWDASQSSIDGDADEDALLADVFGGDWVSLEEAE